MILNPNLEDEAAEEDGVDIEEIMMSVIEIVIGNAIADVRGALVTGNEMAMDPDVEAGLIMTIIGETEVAMPLLPEITAILVEAVAAADTGNQAPLRYPQ